MKNNDDNVILDIYSEASHELFLGHSYVHSEVYGLRNVVEVSSLFILGHRIIDYFLFLLRNTFYYSFKYGISNELNME